MLIDQIFYNERKCKQQNWSQLPECMLPLCTSCEISGKETRIGSDLSIGQCKAKCLQDKTCIGIDFNNDNGKCYFNHDQHVRVSFDADGKFDAWTKSSKCGKVI